MNKIIEREGMNFRVIGLKITNYNSDEDLKRRIETIINFLKEGADHLDTGIRELNTIPIIGKHFTLVDYYNIGSNVKDNENTYVISKIWFEITLERVAKLSPDEDCIETKLDLGNYNEYE